MKVIAVDIGGTNIRHALVDGDSLSVLHRGPNLPTPREDPRALCDIVIQGIESMACNLSSDSTIVAIASAGLVRPSDGSVIALSPEALPALASRLPLRETIKTACGKDVCVLNDAQAATYGEFTVARKREDDLQNFMFVTVSTGTGGGFVLNGKLVQGKNGKAGHLGLAMLCNGARIEDSTCGRYVERSSEKIDVSAGIIAKLIANKTMELDLDCVSLGGGVALGADGYVDRVREKLATFGTPYQTNIYKAVLGDDAGLIGAAAYAVREMES